MSIYLGTQTDNLKGIISAKTKDKIQQYLFTNCYALAVLSAGYPSEFAKFQIIDDTLYLYELWDNMSFDIFTDKTAYIYTCQDNVKLGENINGGYKSNHPFEIVGVNQINIKNEFESLCKSNKIIVNQYSLCDDTEKQKRDIRLNNIINRYNLKNKSDDISILIKSKAK